MDSPAPIIVNIYTAQPDNAVLVKLVSVSDGLGNILAAVNKLGVLMSANNQALTDLKAVDASLASGIAQVITDLQTAITNLSGAPSAAAVETEVANLQALVSQLQAAHAAVSNAPPAQPVDGGTPSTDKP